jgi:hypothetical protein
MATTDNHTIPPANHNLNNTSDDLTPCGCIREQIGFIDETVNVDFTNYDRYAIRDQRFHIYFAHTAVIGGTIAIIIALLQLTGFLPKELSLPGELIATLLSVVAVVTGTLWAFQKRWLLERYKAESFRILKFKSLIQPDFLCGRIELWQRWLEEEVNKIRNLTRNDLHTVVKSGGNIHNQLLPDLLDCDDRTVVAVAGYFTKNLIANQIRYFSQQADERELSDRFIRHLPHLLFFLGVISVAMHFILDYSIGDDGWYFISNILIFFGVAFPIIGIGVRTYRSAHEFARSAAIFKANENRLLDMNSTMESLLKDPQGKKMQILSLLNMCEDLLEEEHYEWLRLMAESEWFI